MDRTTLPRNRRWSPCQARAHRVDHHQPSPAAQDTELNAPGFSFRPYRGFQKRANHEADDRARQFSKNKVVGSSGRLILLPARRSSRAVRRGTAIGFQYQKLAKFQLTRVASLLFYVSRETGGTGSISGVGVLLWPGKPILCSR